MSDDKSLSEQKKTNAAVRDDAKLIWEQPTLKRLGTEEATQNAFGKNHPTPDGNSGTSNS